MRPQMLFQTIPNPHKDGKLTRTLTFEAGPGQRFAIDAEQLHTTPRLLDALHKKSSWVILGLDFTAYLIFAASLVMTFAVAGWLWIPGVIICATILYLVQRSAGSLAMESARKSNSALLYLHSIGALWVVHPAGHA